MDIAEPPISEGLKVVEDIAIWDKSWGNFFSKVWTILSASVQSGTTAQRPTKLLWVGRQYFDTSLGANGKPIWRNKGNTGWVLADGTAA